jgi:ketosteroid isomerase-like protein
MRGKLLLALAAGLLVAADAPAPREVAKALRQLNDAFKGRDADVLQRLMAEDHVAITPYGRQESKEHQIKTLDDFAITAYAMEEVKSQAVTKDVVLFTYTVKYEGTYKGKKLPAKSYAASLWVKRDGKWLEVFYQETQAAKE